MAENTKIQWADHTWNPWIGCARVHAGCLNCYAEAQAGRHGVTWGPSGTRRITSTAYWRKPDKWNREAGTTRPRVFPSLCDPFESWHGQFVDATGRDVRRCEGCNRVFVGECCVDRTHVVATDDDIRGDFFHLIDQTPNLDWLLLTKRPENIFRMFPSAAMAPSRDNVWLLYSASDQETLEAGLPHLLECRDLAPVLGLSLEPLVGPVDLSTVMHTTYGYVENHCTGPDGMVCDLDWVIVGGESGPNARPCNIEWIRDVVRQCQDAGVPCFVKQLGAESYTDNTCTCGQNTDGHWRGPAACFACAGRRKLKDKKGGDPEEWPEDLCVREFPTEDQGD